MQGISTNINHLCESDQEISVKKETGEWTLIHMKEAFRQGVFESAYEMKLLTKKWGFDCTKIICPVEVWHGTEDTLAHIGEIKKLVNILPNCKPNYVTGKGHFLDDDPEIWKQILKSLI